MADLAAALDALERAPVYERCPVPPYLAQLAERDAALHARVLGLIDDAAVPATKLAAALAGDGATFSHDALRRHRRRSGAGGCRCPR